MKTHTRIMTWRAVPREEVGPGGRDKRRDERERGDKGEVELRLPPLWPGASLPSSPPEGPLLLPLPPEGPLLLPSPPEGPLLLPSPPEGPLLLPSPPDGPPPRNNLLPPLPGLRD
ncbi:UNVERIFIED_CONTAM: hypothetical protein FKN15_029470 [Acipenser sinensis]